MLKHIETIATKNLPDLLNLSVKILVIYNIAKEYWGKEGRITPIPKPGKPNDQFAIHC